MRASTERSGYELEARLVVRGGAIKPVRVVAHPVLDAPGDVVQFIGSVVDITERKPSQPHSRSRPRNNRCQP